MKMHAMFPPTLRCKHIFFVLNVFTVYFKSSFIHSDGPAMMLTIP